MQPGSKKRSLGEVSEESSQCMSSTCWSPPTSDSTDQGCVSVRKKPFQAAHDQGQPPASSHPIWDMYHGDANKDVGAAPGQWLQAADSRSGQHFTNALDAALAQYEQRRQQQQQHQHSMDMDAMDTSCSTDEPMPLQATRSLQRTLSAPEMAEMVDAAECSGAFFTPEQRRQRQRQYLSHQDHWLT